MGAEKQPLKPLRWVRNLGRQIPDHTMTAVGFEGGLLPKILLQERNEEASPQVSRLITGFCLPRQPILIHWRALPDLLCLSASHHWSSRTAFILGPDSEAYGFDLEVFLQGSLSLM